MDITTYNSTRSKKLAIFLDVKVLLQGSPIRYSGKLQPLGSQRPTEETLASRWNSSTANVSIFPLYPAISTTLKYHGGHDISSVSISGANSVEV